MLSRISAFIPSRGQRPNQLWESRGGEKEEKEKGKRGGRKTEGGEEPKEGEDPTHVKTTLNAVFVSAICTKKIFLTYNLSRHYPEGLYVNYITQRCCM